MTEQKARAMQDRDGQIWSDGALVRWREARVHMLAHGFQHGMGVFEGTRAYSGELGTAVFRLADHIERLFDSAKILHMKIPFDAPTLIEAHLETIRANGLKQCYLRTNAFYDGTTAGISPLGNSVHVNIAAWEWTAYIAADAHSNGIRIKTSTFNRLHINSALRKAKANGHYINSALAVQEARLQGFNDALLLDTQGYVSECSTSNIFVIRRGRLATPDRTTILEGITRDTIMVLAADRGLHVEERRITRDEVYCADEVFVTGTAAEITPVVEIDQRTIGSGVPGPMTRMLQAAFLDAVSGRDRKHLDWLTPVGS